MTRLVLGTAQFGVAYGATNVHGRLSDAHIAAVFAVAAAGGIDLFDTSPLYGAAQQRLAGLAPAGTAYVSKFALPDDGGAPDRGAVIGGTLAQLGVERLHGLLFHRVDDLRDPRAADAVAVLREARDDGLVGRIGISVYEAADVEAALTVFPDLDILQLPGSIVDRRLIDSPLLRALHDGGAEVHVRSAYLQGILLAEPDALPPPLAVLAPHLAELRAAAAEAGGTLLSAGLRFVRDHPVVDAVVVGASDAADLEGTLAAWNDPAPAPVIAAPELGIDVLDPRRWPPRDSW